MSENKKKKKKPAKPQQTDPPTVGLRHFFKPDAFPPGHTEPYTQDFNTHRTTSEELRAKERDAAQSDPESCYNYDNVRRAAEVHKQVRAYSKANIKPGMKMTDIANLIEDANRALVEHDPQNPTAAGIGFPTGLSLNHCAAHYTPNVKPLHACPVGQPLD